MWAKNIQRLHDMNISYKNKTPDKFDAHGYLLHILNSDKTIRKKYDNTRSPAYIEYREDPPLNF